MNYHEVADQIIENSNLENLRLILVDETNKIIQIMAKEYNESYYRLGGNIVLVFQLLFNENFNVEFYIKHE